jgi:hypothetical protein
MHQEVPAMLSTVEAVKPEQALDQLDAVLDLAGVRMKLADPEEGKGYSMAKLDLLEAEYRKFLALHAAFPDDDVVPCKIVDEFWHQQHPRHPGVPRRL